MSNSTNYFGHFTVIPPHMYGYYTSCQTGAQLKYLEVPNAYHHATKHNLLVRTCIYDYCTTS